MRPALSTLRLLLALMAILTAIGSGALASTGAPCLSGADFDAVQSLSPLVEAGDAAAGDGSASVPAFLVHGISSICGDCAPICPSVTACCALAALPLSPMIMAIAPEHLLPARAEADRDGAGPHTLDRPPRV